MALELRVLGEMGVARNGEALALPPSRKTRALLAYLALSERPQRRDHLVQMFWDIPDDPRGALRWSLSKLRALVDEPGHRRIVADRATVAFDAADAEIDLIDVRQALLREAGIVETASLVALEAVFRGELLAGLELPDCHNFQAWLAAQREDARRLHSKILRELVERFPDTPERTLGYARKLAGVDPFNASAHVLLFRLLLATGRRDEAERQRSLSARTLEEVGAAALRDFQAALAQPSSDHRKSCEPGAGPAGSPSTRPGAPAVRGTVRNDTGTAPAEQEIRFCQTSDGVQLAYATVGDGPPIVKAPNWISHLEFEWESPVWRHWIVELSRNNRLIRYDERGNGLSDWDVDEISFDASLRDLETVVDAVGLDRFTLLGISQGCAVSIAYAIRHPERVNKLVLYGGFARGWKKRGNAAQLERYNALSALMKHGWGQENPAFRQLFTSLFIPGASPEQMAWFNDLQRMTTSPENAVRIRSVRGDTDITGLLPQVTAPTLVCHCLSDAMVPFAEGRYLAMKIPNARFVPLDSRNHLILEDEPAWPRFVYELRRFLEQAPAETASPA